MATHNRVLILVSFLLLTHLPSSASGQDMEDVTDIIVTPSGVLQPGMDVTIEIHVQEFSSTELDITAVQYFDDLGIVTEFHDIGKITLDKQILTLNWTLPDDIALGEWDVCITGIYVCGSFSVYIYDILPAQTKSTIAPGDEIEASVSFASQRDGSPITPDHAEYRVTYLDSDGRQRQVVRQLEGSTDSITFAVPETLCYDVFLMCDALTIDIWANASTNQSEWSQMTFQIAWPGLSVTEPSSLATIPLTKPFRAVAIARMVGGGWAPDWDPVKGALIDVVINQSGESEKIGDDLPTDAAGRLSTVLDISSVTGLDAEAADISFSWRPSSDQDRLWVEVPVILSKEIESTGSTGGINLEINDNGEDLTKGGKTTVSIQAVDNSNRAIPDIWLQYTLERSREISELGTSTSTSGWSAVKTDSNGVASIEVTAPSDLVSGIDELTLKVFGWNKTGGFDFLFVNLDTLEPRIKSDVTPEFWVPGDRASVSIEFQEMTAPITVWWTISQLGQDEWTTFSKTSGTIDIEIPATLPDRSILYSSGDQRLSMTIIAVDAAGNLAADNTYLEELSGLRLQATPVNKVSSAGENFDVSVALSTLGETEMPEGPYSWQVTFTEDMEMAFTGELDEPTGTISIPISDHMSTGTHVVSITMNGVQSIIIVEIRSVEDSTGVKGLASSANTVLSPASPIVSFIALFVALVCFVMIIRNGGRNSEDEPFLGRNKNQLIPPSPSFEPSFGMPPPPTPMTMPASPIQIGPSREMIGSVGHDGNEWLQHEGKTWYRTANSGQEWNQWI